MQINAIDYFEKGARLNCRDKVAIKEQNRAVTFAELERFAKNCAALILKKSTAANRPIPVFLPKSAENIVVKSPPQRLKGMLENLNPGVIVTSAAHAPTLRDLGFAEDRLLLIEQAMVPQESYDNAALLKRLESVIDTDPYCIIHTSGST